MRQIGLSLVMVVASILLVALVLFANEIPQSVWDLVYASPFTNQIGGQ